MKCRHPLWALIAVIMLIPVAASGADHEASGSASGGEDAAPDKVEAATSEAQADNDRSTEGRQGLVTAIQGEVSDPSGLAFGVLGSSASPDGGGIAAVNTAGGPDLVLDGWADGVSDTSIYQDRVEVTSSNPREFSFANTGGGGLTLYVDGTRVVTSATDQDTLAGLHCGPGQVAKWDGTGWACSPDNDTLQALSCGNDQIARWTGSDWACADDLGTVFALTHVVSPVGDWIQNGTALMTALAALPPGRNVVYVEPGYYDLDGASLTLPPGLNLVGGVGSGTSIRSSVCDLPTADGASAATLIVSNPNVVRDLEIVNSCNDPGAAAIAVLSSADSGATFDNVVMKANGDAGACFGLFGFGSVTVDGGMGFSNCSGGTDYGIYTEPAGESGFVDIRNCRALATNGAGMHLDAPYIRVQSVRAFAAATGTGLELAGGDIWVDGIQAGGGSGGSSIAITQGERVKILDAIVFQPVSVDGPNTSATLNGCLPDYHEYGSWDLNVTGGAYVEVMNSTLGTVNVGPGSVAVGASRVGSVVVAAGGSATCAGVWSSGFTFYPSTCP